MHLPEWLLTERVIANPLLLTECVNPWLVDLTYAYRLKASPRPWVDPDLGVIVVKDVRWYTPRGVRDPNGETADFKHYIETDNGPARADDGSLFHDWSPVPIPIPVRLRALAIPYPQPIEGIIQ